MGTSVTVSPATPADAEQLLKLQYLCYQQEALLYDDYRLYPLTQSLDDLRSELEAGPALAARLGEEIVGSVRGHVDADGIGHLGRLIVHPRMQRHGLGSRLVRALERELAAGDAPLTAYRLFTGHRSEGSLRLYRRLGYVQVHSEEVSRRLRVLTLEKPAEHVPLAATA